MEQKSAWAKKKGSLGRRERVGAWRHAFDAADPPSSNKLAIEMLLTRHVLDPGCQRELIMSLL